MSGKAPLPRAIWALGFVSLLMDVSSEMIHGLLPVFLVGMLGTSPVLLGLMEGLAEAIPLFMKAFSGALSDRLGNRKWVTVVGYGMSAATKPLFVIATSTGFVMGARMLDRIGKGVRGAPRDALIADLVPPESRAAAYSRTASWPSAVTLTSRPSRSSRVFVIIRIGSSSSMNRIRPLIGSNAPATGAGRNGSGRAAGSQIRKVVPVPTLDSTAMWPRCFLITE